MKKLQKIKLNKLSVEALENRDMNQLAGGCTTNKCVCSCCYQNSGGSSTNDNRNANSLKGLGTYHPTHENMGSCDANIIWTVYSDCMNSSCEDSISYKPPYVYS